MLEIKLNFHFNERYFNKIYHLCILGCVQNVNRMKEISWMRLQSVKSFSKDAYIQRYEGRNRRTTVLRDRLKPAF